VHRWLLRLLLRPSLVSLLRARWSRRRRRHRGGHSGEAKEVGAPLLQRQAWRTLRTVHHHRCLQVLRLYQLLLRTTRHRAREVEEVLQPILLCVRSSQLAL
tara:strand:- start:52 stop:354 length:303 start_codon:yes stop_codon:yes gene_type:complete